MNEYTFIDADHVTIKVVAPTFAAALSMYRAITAGVDPEMGYISAININLTAAVPSVTVAGVIVGTGAIYPVTPFMLYPGAEAILTAVPEMGSTFTQWLVNGLPVTDNPLRLTVIEDTQVTAEFA